MKKTRPQKKITLVIIGLSIVAIIAVFLLDNSGVLKYANGIFYNIYSRSTKPLPIEEGIVLVEIGDEDLDILGKWSWPRDYHASLLYILNAYGAKAVGYDILFVDPDSQNPRGDAIFADAIKKVYPTCPVLLPGFFPGSSEEIRRKTVTDALKVSKDGFASPIDVLGNACPVKAFVNDFPDADHTHRRYPLFIKHGAKIYPSFALALTSLHFGIDASKDVLFDATGATIEAPGRSTIQIPLFRGDMFVRFNTSRKNFPKYHFYEIIAAHEGKIDMDLDFLKDKIVIVGGTAVGFNEDKEVPLRHQLYGIEVQASIISNILNQNFIYPVNKKIYYSALILVSALLILTFRYTGHFSGFAVFIFVSAVIYYAGKYFFHVHATWFEPTAFLVATSFIYVMHLGVRYFFEEKEKRWIRRAFGHYISRSVMEEILADPARLKLGGEKRILTVLFADIRGFTSYCETHDPEEVVLLLNEFLDTMTRVIFRCNGTLDKYVGDEILALFGAPLSTYSEDHAKNAVMAALEMMRELELLRRKWRKEGKEDFGMGVGINTGEMVVGNMGSLEVMNYTVIGDEVNLGARVEALTRKFDANIIITESTYDKVKDIVEVSSLGEVQVKGRLKSVGIYELKGLRIK